MIAVPLSPQFNELWKHFFSLLTRLMAFRQFGQEQTHMTLRVDSSHCHETHSFTNLLRLHSLSKFQRREVFTALVNLPSACSILSSTWLVDPLSARGLGNVRTQQKLWKISSLALCCNKIVYPVHSRQPTKIYWGCNLTIEHFSVFKKNCWWNQRA